MNTFVFSFCPLVLLLLSHFFDYNICFFLAQNLCVTAAYCPIRELLEKEKKVCSFSVVHFTSVKKCY
jgi:hypothetical protein